jgi:hypothetical protein
VRAAALRGVAHVVGLRREVTGVALLAVLAGCASAEWSASPASGEWNAPATSAQVTCQQDGGVWRQALTYCEMSSGGGM